MSEVWARLLHPAQRPDLAPFVSSIPNIVLRLFLLFYSVHFIPHFIPQVRAFSDLFIEFQLQSRESNLLQSPGTTTSDTKTKARFQKFSSWGGRGQALLEAAAAGEQSAHLVCLGGRPSNELLAFQVSPIFNCAIRKVKF